ncbi:MAG: NAD(P)-binding protein [Lachnospiraceae bacterium]|nr:NAD(P)-binding protein [Lachnospiraceae bacterium]
MLRLEQVRIPIDPGKRREPWKPEAALKRKAASVLHLDPTGIETVTIVRHSIDARRKPRLFDVWTLDVELSDKRAEEKLASKLPAGVSLRKPPAEHPMAAVSDRKCLTARPVVVGAGPAGLFCAYALAKAGFRPLLLERGADTAERDAAVRKFWSDGSLDPENNIPFGLGGAGTFSDGKLSTGVRDHSGDGAEILRAFVAMGAPADILYEAHPHIGTDILKGVVENFRRQIEENGGEVLLKTRLTGIAFDGKSGRLTGITTTAGDFSEQVLVLAIGHSARDTFAMLCENGLEMEQKAFAVGFRVAHPQEMIDRAQYGMPAGDQLPPAVYKLTANACGRGVYSFCMCPGGRIVNASSEPGRLCVNGMSERARDGRYANSAIVVTVAPEDYRVDGLPLEGVAFQRTLEERAFRAGAGRIPVSSYIDFAKRVRGVSGSFPAAPDPADPAACFCGGFHYADLSGILSEELNEAIVTAMPLFGRQIRGYDGAEALFAGIESRTSSPVRMPRGGDGQATGHAGVYPCGEGAGYAGGIMSAAMDGLRTARQIMEQYAPAGEHI